MNTAVNTDMEITFVDAWRRDDPELAVAAKAFWERNSLVPAGERERRVSELCVLGYVGDELAALSTAALTINPQLHARVAMYRCAVAPAFRRHDVSYRISGHSRFLLEAWSAEHPEEKLMGMAAVIQAAEYRDKQREPIWPEYGLELNLAGWTDRGEQLRVAWFRHAKLEPYVR